jgi:hypothetical protein
MGARRLILIISLCLVLPFWLAPNSPAQNRGTFVGAVHYTAGPLKVTTSTNYWLEGVSSVEIHPGCLNVVGELGVFAAASCAYDSFPACPK